MIGNSRPEWALIQTSILIFRFTPLMYVYLLLGLTVHTTVDPSYRHRTVRAVLALLLVAEAAFYALLYRPHLRRAAAPKAAHPAPLTKTERDALFDRCVAHSRDPELYLRGWFHGAPLAHIRRGNVREFFLWAFFETSEEELRARPQEEQEQTLVEVDGYVGALEHRLGHVFEDGRGRVKSVRLTLEPVVTAYRGLVWYSVMMMVDAATTAILRWHGFRFYARSDAAEVLATFPPRPQELLSRYKSPSQKLGYWYYEAPSQKDSMGKTRSATKKTKDTHLPVVFFHGIGVGLLTYLHFIIDLLKAGKDSGMSIMAVEMLPVSFRLTSPPLEKREFLEAFTTIIDSHGWGDFSIVSHSYGSVPTTHILTADAALSSRARAATLVDPVTIMLHLPNVAYNFTRRQPSSAAEWQLWYFASTDVGVATVLGRHFFWRQNIVWKEDLLVLPDGSPRRVTVSLAAKDIIVNAPAVAQYLQEPQQLGVAGTEKPEAHVLWFPELDHAQVFDTQADYKRIIERIISVGEQD